jgi:ABC-2 type transport system ATP-binding protein
MNTPSSVLPLSVENVFKSYGSVQALRGVSFDVKRGEVFGLLGPNGAGKTSLISCLVSLENATSGKLQVFGHDVSSNPRQAKMNTGWVPQEIINHGFFNITEILTFHAGYYGEKKPKERVKYLLERLDLWAHREKKVKQLSGGMKRRLMIAKALVHKPGLLLLDEPTAGVDVELRTKLWTFVEELKSEGISILLTTHYLEEAERLCDRVAIIHKGQLRAIGKTHGLIEEWSRKRTVLRLTHPIKDLTHPDLVSGANDEWTFLTKMSKPLGELLTELKLPNDALKDVQVQEGSLEDVFVKLTQEEEAKK